MKRSTFDEVIADAESFDARLTNMTVFHDSRTGFYHEMARAIARRIMLPEMPSGHDRDQWRQKVERAVDRVVTELMLAPGGIMISISPAPDTSGSLVQRPSHDDVVAWIKAGENGVPGGKRITDVDRKRMADAGGGEAGYRAVATIVMRAYYARASRSNYTRLRSAIQTYLHGAKETERPAILDAVVAAWMQYFEVRYFMDVIQHAADECQRF